MATFTYKALDGRGATASGQIDGDNKAAVAANLRNKGLTVVDINEVKIGLGQKDIFASMQRVKAKDLTVFSRQFATMINSGLSMLRALSVLEEQTENKKLATVLGQVRGDVEAGIALSDALAKHPKVFSPLYVNMVRAGEIGGILDEVLNRLATQLEKDDNIRRAVKSAMVYPVMIASFALIVMLGMVEGTYAPNGKLKAENRWRTPAALRAQLEDGLIAEWRVYADNEPIRERMRKNR